MGLRGTCWATALELVHFAKWQTRLYQHEYHEHVWTSWTIFVHISQIWEAQMYWQRGVFRFLILGETAAKPWKPGFDLSGCQLQPTHNLYSPCCCIGSDAKAEFRALPWRLMQAPQTFWFYFLFCMFRMMGSVFGGRLLSCIFLSNVALFYPLAQIGPMAARKKYWAVALLRPSCFEINTCPTKCAAVRFLWAKCCWRAADFEPVSAHDQVYS